MKETNERVYRCDHCNKAMVRVGLMKLHERTCKQNPNNQHKCFLYCEHLIKSKEDTYRGDEYNNSETVFRCKLNPYVKLFSYKLERYKSNELRCKGMTRMPLECDLYETMKGHDYEERLGADDDWFDI